jgi:hypothetical protein
MLRLSEAGLFLVPFGLAMAWWVLGWRSRRVVWAAVGALALLAALLLWFGTAGSLSRADRYVPAHIGDGRIVGGHGA